MTFSQNTKFRENALYFREITKLVSLPFSENFAKRNSVKNPSSRAHTSAALLFYSILWFHWLQYSKRVHPPFDWRDLEIYYLGMNIDRNIRMSSSTSSGTRLNITRALPCPVLSKRPANQLYHYTNPTRICWSCNIYKHFIIAAIESGWLVWV